MCTLLLLILVRNNEHYDSIVERNVEEWATLVELYEGNNGKLSNSLLPECDDTSALVEYMYHSNMLIRKSKDKAVVNRHDHELIDLCKDTSLLILNGRVGQGRHDGTKLCGLSHNVPQALRNDQSIQSSAETPGIRSWGYDIYNRK